MSGTGLQHSLDISWKHLVTELQDLINTDKIGTSGFFSK